MKKTKTILANSFLALISIIIALFLAEGTLALLGMEKSFTEPHPTLGHFHIPSAGTCIRHADFKNCFKLNSLGLMNEEMKLKKKRGVYRIGIFGDSFVEAVQVPMEKNYVSLIENRLNRKAGEKGLYETVNFGVRGYSLANSYLLFKTLGAKLDLDAVVLVLFVGNDIVGNDKYLIKHIPGFVTLNPEKAPFFKLAPDGKLKLIPFEVPEIKRQRKFMRKYFGRVDRLILSAELIWKKAIAVEENEGMRPEYEIFTAAPNDAHWETAYKVTFALIREMRLMARDRGQTFLLVLMPMCEQVEKERWENLKEKHPVLSHSDIEGPNKKLREMLDGEGITYVDLLKPFSNNSNVEKSLYLPIDRHLNEDGHRLTADILTEEIEKTF